MKNILNKLHKIMSEVEYIQKDKRNDFHKYSYASEQVIKQTLHKKLVEHKVLFTLDANSISTEQELTNITFTYHFYDIESEEELKGNFVGSGKDNGDKGAYKAITGAIKYILTSTFLIPTGDDPEDQEEKENDEESELNKFFGEPVNEPPKKLGIDIEREVIDLSQFNSKKLDPNVCKDCGEIKIMGKKGLYCKPCYIKWANTNKK